MTSFSIHAFLSECRFSIELKAESKHFIIMKTFSMRTELEKIVQILSSAPAGEIRIEIYPQDKDLQLSLDLQFHLRTILYRIGHELLRGVYRKNNLPPYPDFILSWHEQKFNHPMRSSRQLEISLQREISAENLGNKGTKKTALALSLLNLHLQKLSAWIYKNESGYIIVVDLNSRV